MSALPAPFRWEGPVLAATLPGALACFTGRAGADPAGPAAGLDLARGAERLDENRERVASLIGIPGEHWAQSEQVHGVVVRRVRGTDDLLGDRGPADGQAVAVPGVAGVVLTADCLPVVVAGMGAVAVLHAGWRGLADGVLEEGVRALRELGESGRLEALIGPGAGGCCYEVGPEVRAAFVPDGVLASAAPAPIDLKAVAARRLRAAGVGRVHDCDLCTLCAVDPATGGRRYFSHRADGGTTGRQAGLAWLS